MADATFDGPNLIIQIPSTGTFDVQRDLYSAWKRWVLIGDNAKYYPAFETIGGDDIGDNQTVAPYFFVRNDLGWQVRAPEENGETKLTGNIFPRNPAGTTFVQAAGYDAFITVRLSTNAVVVTVPTGSTPLGDIADAVWNAPLGDHQEAGSTGEKHNKTATKEDVINASQI